MMVLLVAVQVALHESQVRGGFTSPDIFDFGGANFLKSAVPVVLSMPVPYLWGKVDQAIVAMHPYIVLGKGHAPAEKSLLLSYGGGRITTMHRSLFNAHFLVFFSSLVVLLSFTLPPLASSILTSRGTNVTIPNVLVTSERSLGLIPDVESLETFLAAASYAFAASVQELPPAPFTLGSWAVAQFVIPPPGGPGSNGTIHVPTTGIQTTSGCSVPDTLSISTSNPGQTNGTLVLSATWGGCGVTVSTPDIGQDQFGVVPAPSCSNQTNTPSQFQPVAFWFLIESESFGMPGFILCQPQTEAWNVVAAVDLSTGRLTDVQKVNTNVPANNFTGPPLNGQTYNGVQFNMSNANVLDQARALAIQSSLPDAIFRAVKSLQPDGLVETIMWDWSPSHPLLAQTDQIYTNFLSTVAQTTYFVSDNTTINSSIVSWELRLWVYPVAAHAFAAASVLIAIIAILLHWSHSRARQDVHLSCDPLTMAATLSMTSESNWRRVLQAGDTEDDIKEKLQGMSFGISRRTWQVVEEGEEARVVNGVGGGLPYAEGGLAATGSPASTAKGVDSWEKGSA